MLLQQELIGNSRAGLAQWDDVRASRLAANRQERMFVNNGQLATNAGLIPQDVYQEFDNVTVERFRSDDGDTFLNDLLPLSRSINIGKLIHKFRRASDAGSAQSSMTGQIGVKMDQVEFTYDGSIVPIHDTGFGRNWREWNAQSSEGFDALIDDQRESVSTIRRHIADSFLDGHKDKDGNAIVMDAISWAGMRADARVNQVDLGVGGINFDFTDTTQTGAAIKAAFVQVRDVLFITNKVEQDATYYISREIASNWERRFETTDPLRILTEMSGLMGVSSIKVSSKLTGNEIMAFTGNSVRPIVGMGLNTVSLPRPVYNSNYEFVVWGAIGWEVRNDFAGNSGALFATG